MDLITLGRTLGFSFAAGVNLYATVAILGLAARYGWVELPPQFQMFNHDVVIGAAIVMYLIEFFADKIPYLDSLWDLIHTAIRPVGWRAHRRRHARRSVRAHGGADCAARWHCGGEQSPHQDQHPRRGQRKPGTGIQLGPQFRRGPLRSRPRIPRASASDCGARHRLGSCLA